MTWTMTGLKIKQIDSHIDTKYKQQIKVSLQNYNNQGYKKNL